MRKSTKHETLRSGYTTGTCAAAAARGATVSLLYQQPVTTAEVDLPGKHRISFNIKHCVFDNNSATCTVIKDAGDDPDITDGAEISATVVRKDVPGVTITGGQGVGTITKPGLEIPPGMAAINPVPRQMIESAVKKVLQRSNELKGVNVIISVNGGEELAKKTLNSRLGIVGGISILGTTGVVIPYSLDAYKASISIALDIAVACDCSQVVLTTGRRSEKFAQNVIALPVECFIQVGDFIGYSLEKCASKGIPHVTIWGMTGKISKLAAGHMYTNVSDSHVDISFLIKLAAHCGLSKENQKDLEAAVTANHLRRLLPEQFVRVFCDKLCQLAAENCRNQIKGKSEIECIMSDYNGSVLGRYHAGK